MTLRPGEMGKIKESTMKFREYLIEKTESTPMECIECGKKFKKKLGPKTFEVKCPKCGSYDTEPA